MKALRWVLLAQIAFFAVWGGSLLTSHRVAQEVWLETGPVDPRDLLAGHYVALTYPLVRNAEELCETVRPRSSPGPVYVRLAPGSEPVLTIEGPVTPSHGVECRADPPRGDAGTWIAGERRPQPATSRIQFGIERFYVPEASPLRRVPSGQAVAKIAINDAHVPRILDLVPTLPDETPGPR